MYANRVVSGDMDMGDNDYINGTMFRKLPPLPVMENNRPTETGKTESCFQKNWSIALKVSLLGLIALLSILLIIVSALSASVRVEEGNKSNKTTKENDNYPGQEKVMCPETWNRRGDSCYSFNHGTENWQDAMNSCATQQSKLLILTSKEEMDSLVPLMSGRTYWIGLHKHFSTWTWLDGTPLTFSKWNPNEPNNVDGKEFCVEMKSDGWNDLNCDIKMFYICKK